MLLYLHGFASSGNATKAGVLRDFVSQHNKRIPEEVISPDLSEIPDKAIEKICGLIEKSTEKPVVFGSSLGGFYAAYACLKYDLKTVLINPAMKPHIALKQVVGTNKNYSTGIEFEFKSEYLLQLQSYFDEIKPGKLNYDNIVLMLAKDDSLLNYKQTLEYFGNHIKYLVLEEQSGHNFSTFGQCLPKVFEFLGYEM